jgi:hypothetical protein
MGHLRVLSLANMSLAEQARFDPSATDYTRGRVDCRWPAPLKLLASAGTA